MKVTQHLWFEKDMEAAIGFYTSLIPGSSVHWISGLPADTPSGPAGSVRIASFTLGDQRYMAFLFFLTFASPGFFVHSCEPRAAHARSR